MSKNTAFIGGIIVLAIVAGGVYVSMNNKDDAMITNDKMEQQATEDQKMVEEKAMMDKKVMEGTDTMIKSDSEMKEDMMQKDETSMDKGETMVKAGSYEPYSPEKIARAETGDVVLFFHASWCPSCRGLNSSIENNLGSIPPGLSILKTDYDKETELKKKYGVTYQHTLVQVDKDGKILKKWSGSSSLDSLLSQVQ